jgi:hypothetical protein
MAGQIDDPTGDIEEDEKSVENEKEIGIRRTRKHSEAAEYGGKTGLIRSSRLPAGLILNLILYAHLYIF